MKIQIALTIVIISVLSACNSTSYNSTDPIQKDNTSTLEIETQIWSEIENSQDISLLNSYLESYPNGKYALLAKVKIRKLKRINAEEKATQAKALLTKAQSQVDTISLDGVNQLRQESVAISPSATTTKQWDEVIQKVKTRIRKEMVLPTVFDTVELQLSYYIGFNVAESIQKSNSFSLNLEQAKQGVLDGANGIESVVSQNQLQSADAILRFRFEENKNQQAETAEGVATDSEAETTEEATQEISAEYLEAVSHLSYYIGFNISTSLISSDTFDFDVGAIIVGLIDGDAGNESQVTPEQLEAADEILRDRFIDKQMKGDRP